MRISPTYGGALRVPKYLQYMIADHHSEYLGIVVAYKVPDLESHLYRKPRIGEAGKHSRSLTFLVALNWVSCCRSRVKIRECEEKKGCEGEKRSCKIVFRPTFGKRYRCF